MNQEIKSFVKVTIFINLIVLGISSLVLLILSQYSLLFGYLLGSMVSNLTFIMHANHVNNLGSNGKHPFISAITSTGIRLLVSALALLLALFIDVFNIYATFIGLFTIKLIIFIVSIVLEKNKKKNISKGGEVEENDIIINE